MAVLENNVPTGDLTPYSWGSVDNIGDFNLSLAMPCDTRGWRHLYGPRFAGPAATLLYVDVYNGSGSLGFGDPYTAGTGSPLSAEDAWNALSNGILDPDEGWQIISVGHDVGSHTSGSPHSHGAIGTAVTDVYNDEIARQLLQENHPLIFKNSDGSYGTGGPSSRGLANPTHSYSNQTEGGYRFGPFYVDNDHTTLRRTDNGVEHWNLVQRVIYATRQNLPSQTRNFLGLIRCQENHEHGSPSVSQDFLQGIPASELIIPVNAGASATGGYNPELIFYGGDLHGVQGYADVTNGQVTNITITDPGASAVPLVPKTPSGQPRDLIPPEVILSTPSDSGNDLFEGFDASVNMSTAPADIQAAYSNLNLAATDQELQAAFCSVLGGVDPLAQTFLVSNIGAGVHGIFVSSVDVCFSSKPTGTMERDDVVLQLRPCTAGGLPQRKAVLDCFGEPAEARKSWDDVTTRNGIMPAQGGTGMPRFDETGSFTKFTFPRPIYLAPDTYYAIVVMSNDPAYKLWVNDVTSRLLVDGELAGTVSDSGATTSESGRSNHGGTLFKSQNGFTWTEDQNKDMMFRINRCNFKNTSGSVDVHLGNSLASEINYDQLYLNMNHGTGTLIPNEAATQIAKTHTMRADSGGATSVLGTTNIPTNITHNMSERMELRASQTTGDLKVSTTLTTTDTAVSPVIDVSEWQCILNKNFINNGELSDGLIKIPVGGTGSGFSVNDTLTVSGGGGNGAIVTVTGETGGAITSATFSETGSGYYKKAIVNSAASDGSGTGAEIEIDGEEGPSGGNAKFRYITKPVVLAQGMDASGLKLFLTAKTPVGAKLYAYYKVMSNEDGDGEGISDKSWRVMRQKSPDSSYSSEAFGEFEFDTEGDDITYSTTNEDGTISHYDSFNSFAIKIVGHASDTTKPPIVHDLRAIAVT
jgi:hypothetical protein